MPTDSEKQEFAARLKVALGRGRRSISTPTQLASAFNLIYRGRSITSQAAQKWMSGAAIPAADKLETLAAMFRVPLKWLKYGHPGDDSPNEGGMLVNLQEPTAEEHALLSQWRSLSANRRRLLQQLISEFAFDQETSASKPEATEAC